MKLMKAVCVFLLQYRCNDDVNACWNCKTSANMKSNREVSGSDQIVRYKSISEDDDIATPLILFKSS